MRIQEIAVKWGTTHYRASLSRAQHCIVAPADLPLRALRDALCAALYGPEHFPGAARGGLRNAGLRFEVNGIDYKCLVDLSTGKRVLLRVGPPAETLADSPGAVAQALSGLLHLPSAIVYRSLALSTVDFPTQRAPRIPPGQHRALLAHARQPERLAAELAEAAAQVERVRIDLRAPSTAIPLRDPIALAGAGLGGICLALSAFASGPVVAAGFATPLALGATAWRSLRWIDATETRTRALKALDEAESAVRARRRQHDELEAHLAAVERATGGRSAENVESVLNASQSAAPEPEILDHVEVYAGDPPRPEAMAPLVAAFGVGGSAAASGGLVLAAMRARGSRAAPLLWVADGERPSGVTWDRVFGELDESTPLLVFRSSTAGAGEHGVNLAPMADP